MKIRIHLAVCRDLALTWILLPFLLIEFAAPAFGLQLSTEEQAFLQQKKRIVFISQAQYPPFEFVDEQGQHDGIMIDVARWMAVEIGFQPVFVADSFQKAQEAVLSGDADVLTSLFFSQKRQERFLFTEPLFDVPASIFVRAERTDMKSIQDLNGKVIAIQRGDYAKEFLETKGIRFQILDTDNFAQATDAVIAGRADAVIGDEQIVLYHIYQNRLNQDIKRIADPLYVGKNCMASRPQNTLLIGILNKGIAEARSTGVLDKITEKWLGKAFGQPSSYFERHRKEIAAGFVLLLIGLIGIWFWNVQLRRTVRRQTKQILARENALRESERNFRTFFETMDDMIVVGTPDGKILYTNPAIHRKLGYSTDDLETMNLLDFHPAQKRSEAEAIFAAMFQGERDVCPLPLATKAGVLVPVETRVWFGQWNGIDCIYWICKDLRKEQEALQLFNRIFNHNPAVMAITRATDGVFVDINEAFVNTLGYSREEVIGKTIADLSLFARPQDHQDAFRTLHQNRRLFDRELDVRCKDGSVRHGIFYGEAIENQGEHLFLTVMIDQTSRRNAEESLRREYAFRNTILENIAEGLYVCQQVTEKPFIRYTAWNRSMIQITGYTLEEINQYGCYPLVPDEEARIRAKDRIQKSFQQDHLRNEEWLIVRKDGKKRWVSISTSTVKMDGGTVHVLGLVQDITEQKRMEEERRTMEQRLQQIEKAESLSRMAGAIAHHFNNQLMVILGHLDMLADSFAEDQQALLHIDAMRKATQKASEISRLMLVYLGQSFERRVPTDIIEVFRQNLPAIVTLVPSHIRLDANIPEAKFQANLNAALIRQVLIQLVTNAIEAIGDRPGTIRISFRTVDGPTIPVRHRHPVDREPLDSPYVCIDIADNGCGIREDRIDSIVDPFYTSKFTGRGMGLAVVIGILRSHEGFLEIESEPQKGSHFRIYLPVIQTVSLAPPTPSDQEPLGPDFKLEGVVLLVEDEALVRDVTETILKRLGFSVVSAANGVEAVQLFEKTPEKFRLVISDVAMPLMDGWETLSALRRIRPDIPVILASGYNEAHVLAGEHEDLPQAVLEKPYHVKDLMDAVRKILEPVR